MVGDLWPCAGRGSRICRIGMATSGPASGLEGVRASRGRHGGVGVDEIDEPQFEPEDDAGRARRREHLRWLGEVNQAGGCLHPVRLYGQNLDTSTGEHFSAKRSRSPSEMSTWRPAGSWSIRRCPS